MSAGAYGYTMASRYNARPLPAEVLVKGSAFELVGARDTFEQMIAGETHPGVPPMNGARARRREIRRRRRRRVGHGFRAAPGAAWATPSRLAPRRPEQAAALAADRARTPTIFPGSLSRRSCEIDRGPGGGRGGRRGRVRRLPRPGAARDRRPAARGRAGRRRPAVPGREPGQGPGGRHATCGPRRCWPRSCPARRVGALTGPTNAAEVARGLPAAMVLAAARPARRPAANSRRRSAARPCGCTRATTWPAWNSAGP